jgi:hypothetical protein
MDVDYQSYQPDLTTLLPGDIMLLWADNEPQQGTLHLGFKLDKDGEQVGIFKESDGDMIPIDSVSFSSLLTGLSLGRYPDGTGSWEIFNPPTPGKFNYHVGQEEKPAESIPGIMVYPNPTHGQISISCHPADSFNPSLAVEISIYNHTGQLIIDKIIHSGFPVEADLSGYPAGIYLVRINDSKTIISKQVMLIR